MIPVKEGSEFNQLGQSSLARFQTRCKEIKLLILDEKSMVGRSQVGRIGPSPVPGSSSNADEIFGGITNYLFFGDFGQLPPVGDSLLYSEQTIRIIVQLFMQKAIVCLSLLNSLSL